MKILLDENIDVRFKKYLDEFHDVFTVNDMHWNGIKNGELLKLISANDFDCWKVVDKNIQYQQNLSRLPCKVIIIDIYKNVLKNLLPLIPEVLVLLSSGTTNDVFILKEKE